MPPSIHDIIAQNLIALRQKLNLKQEAVAGFLGIQRELLSYYENGRRAVQPEHLKKLADLFGVDEYDLTEPDAGQQNVNLALAFRADELTPEGLESLAAFRKIVKNYLQLKKAHAATA